MGTSHADKNKYKHKHFFIFFTLSIMQTDNAVLFIRTPEWESYHSEAQHYLARQYCSDNNINLVDVFLETREDFEKEKYRFADALFAATSRKDVTILIVNDLRYIAADDGNANELIVFLEKHKVRLISLFHEVMYAPYFAAVQHSTKTQKVEAEQSHRRSNKRIHKP